MLKRAWLVLSGLWAALLIWINFMDGTPKLALSFWLVVAASLAIG